MPQRTGPVTALAAVAAFALVSTAPLAHAAPLTEPSTTGVCDKADGSTTEYKSKDGYSKINARFCVQVTTAADGTRTVASSH
ncbi:hypothetical protein GCM10010441_13110 [Kitasatospora paracochleata]|uniref:Secreted protein n=1 Tax=Kitasatospora paracochleata TaxID=58354 RepID=A0ABT1JAV3_9ACTN|nr:hypothetical protein [Kitasatospora paracochleata]MCP2314589.1 hypothetical protein [Kitasatospora paracochleata]